MNNLTSTNLDAAFIDQMVAGAFHGLRYAYAVVTTDDGGFALGVAVKDEAGYTPVAGKAFDTEADARHWADSLNEHIGLLPIDAIEIVASSMRIGRGSPNLTKW
jgi:hypothetical protein